jgi:hypothetical protein
MSKGVVLERLFKGGACPEEEATWGKSLGVAIQEEN